VNNLGRTTAHRKALMSNLCCQLIEHKRIFTTLAKAKALRGYVEPLITRSKTDDMNNRRVVFSKLQDKEAVKELFGVIGDKVADRPGGYTRIIKLPHRMGDASEMAMIELVDFNEIYGKEKEVAAAKKTRRSRRYGGKKGDSQESGNTSDAATTETHSTEENVAVAEAEAMHETATEEVAAAHEVEAEAPSEAAPEATHEAPAQDTATEESGEAQVSL